MKPPCKVLGITSQKCEIASGYIPATQRWQQHQKLSVASVCHDVKCSLAKSQYERTSFPTNAGLYQILATMFFPLHKKDLNMFAWWQARLNSLNSRAPQRL